MICNNHETVWVRGHEIKVRCGHVYNNHLGFTVVAQCAECAERDRKATEVAFRRAREREAAAAASQIIENEDGTASFGGILPAGIPL